MSNYCGYITTIKQLRPHPSADRLQIATIFGNDTIVDLKTQLGQLGVYFCVGTQLSEQFCAANDLVRRRDAAGNPAGGYLDPDKRNIKAMRMRGEKSDGLFLPITCLANFCEISSLKEGDTIETLNGVEICRKYIPRTNPRGNNHQVNKVKKKKINFAPTFYEHVDTKQLAYNLDAFKPGDIVELTLKMHGTSGRTGYLPLVHQKKRTWLDKLLRRPAKQYTEYGYVNGTRRVVLDDRHDGGFYEDNSFRPAMSKKYFEGKLNKGECVYYEIVGYCGPNGAPIMASASNKKMDDEFRLWYGEETVFSYDCIQKNSYEDEHPCCEVYVYRMTMVNEDGAVVEYSPAQMRVRCKEIGVKCVPVFETFIIPDDVDCLCVDVQTGEQSTMTAGEYVLRKVEEYFDGPDPIGKTHIREGVVARIVNCSNFAVFKHKNFNFKQITGIAVEQAVSDGSIENMTEDMIEEL